MIKKNRRLSIRPISCHSYLSIPKSLFTFLPFYSFTLKSLFTFLLFYLFTLI